MAKKKEEKINVQVNFQLNKDVVDLIDAYGKALGLDRSKMVRNLVLTGLDDAKVLKAVGVLDVVGLIRSLKKKPVPTLEMKEVV
jgi:hypothetical protein